MVREVALTQPVLEGVECKTFLLHFIRGLLKVHVPLTYGGKCLRIVSKAADRILQTALLIQNS